ncbi:MAG: branched-chain amino acid ABC transporter permease [Synergistaceae bacterium]|jgi:branched-chain amino acid transport system permease protein|nr:branched-chain amino acid ABC transporter permease [Synergistaceae bacterium]
MKTKNTFINSALPRLNGALGKAGLSLVSLAAFIAIGLLPFYAGDEYIIRLGVSCLMYGALAMGFDLSAGFIDVANWGYAALMGLSGYVSALLYANFGLSPWLGLFAGALSATLLGLGIALLTLKMDGLFTALLAWFVGIILMSVVTALPGITRGVLGLSVEPLFDTPWSTPYYYVIFVICLATFITLRIVVKSHFGLAFRALGQDMEAAKYSGVNPVKYRTINFLISCFIAGLCGAFYAHFVGILTPSVMATRNTVQILVIAYIGGRGSIWGPLMAAFIILPVFESLNSMLELKYIIYGIMLIFVMIYYPGGLSSLIDWIKGWFAAKLKDKRTAGRS